MMLECKIVKLFWKIISRIAYYICGIRIEINEKILVIGYEIDNPDFYLINLMIIFPDTLIFSNIGSSLLEKRSCTNSEFWVA